MSKNDHAVAVMEMLEGLEFPTSRKQIVAQAEDNGATELVLDQLQALPRDSYESADVLSNHLSEINKIPGQDNLWSSKKSDDIPEKTTEGVRDVVR